MSKTVLMRGGDAHDAGVLAALIKAAQDMIPNDPMHGKVVYVRDQLGRDVRTVSFESETLTDGSVIYNLILHIED